MLTELRFVQSKHTSPRLISTETELIQQVTPMSATANRIIVACALAAFGLIASDNPAFAKKRACSQVEASHVPASAIEKCYIAGKDILCDEVTGKAYCCNANGTKCGNSISTRVTIPPPPPKPPSVKLDVPRIDSVSQPPRPPRVDTVPSSVGPAKPPAGPKVN
jgi:hypothetical protein